jgi:hypothetical protein
MWICKLCSHETKKRANLIRHLKLVHNISDREGRNATKNSNTSAELCRADQMDTSESSNDHKLPSIMMNDRRSISEEGCHEKIQHGEIRRQKYGMCKQQPIIELDNFEESSGNEPKSDPYDRQYTTEQIERFGAELTAKKCHILDCVMKTIPEHLKAKTKLICDALKCRDHFFIKSNYEIIDGGSTIQGSNVYAVIIDLLTKRVNTKDVGTQTGQRF